MARQRTRREFLRSAGSMVTGAGLLSAWPWQGSVNAADPVADRPNVVLIMSDDQGYGDLGCHGNEAIDTPNLDGLAEESVEVTSFFVCPCCAPTRASLMTGRYNYRTGVVDTYMGRAMMYPDEVTIAELLQGAGYRTGIFGKWHLGDNHPLRPMDQGFDDVLIHKGSGIGFVADPKGNKYFDPILQHNGEPVRYEGYCTDIFTDGAIEFIQQNRSRPFFVYLAPNAPHEPLQISGNYSAPYRAKGLPDSVARVYGMITNIDDNVGRLLAVLQELSLEQNTIVVFLSDNGPWWNPPTSMPRYNVGLRGTKTQVYEGGIRSPFFIRWPARLEAGRKVEQIAAHLDLLPTLLDACDVGIPPDVSLDGMNLMPILQGVGEDWPERTLYFQWHRGDRPELYHNCAARSQRHKLVDGRELYDLEVDPGERRDISGSHPDLVAEMRRGYVEWFRNVASTRDFVPPSIRLGTRFENPVILTPLDCRGPNARWVWKRLDSGGWYWLGPGYWEVEIAHPGTYEVSVEFPTLTSPATVFITVGEQAAMKEVKAWESGCTFSSLDLQPGETQLEVWLAVEDKVAGVAYVHVNRLGGYPGEANRHGKMSTTWAYVRQTAMHPNYPNPFNPETWFPYELAVDALVQFRIYNVHGEVVRHLELGLKEAGGYLDKSKAVHWDGTNDQGQSVSSGVYFCQFISGTHTSTRKIVLAE